MRRSMTTVAVASAALLLTACGGGGSDPLTQEQTAEAILSEEEFPLEGWTRGSVTPIELGEDDAAEDTVEDFFGEDLDVSEECRDALGVMNQGGAESITAGSSATFSDASSADIIPTEVELMVAVVDGDSPLTQMSALNQHCSDIEITEGPITLTITFAEVSELQGSKVTLSGMGADIEIIVAGEQDGDTMVGVVSTGLTEEQAKQIVDAQQAKVDSIG